MPDILNSQREIKDLADLKKFWSAMLPHIQERCIVLMSGEVGAGKTTSVKMIADLLEMHNVQSPSFAIHLRYESADGKSLDHIDLYRLEDDDDLESSGFWDLFAQTSSLVVIEWSNRLNVEFLPMNWQKIQVNISRVSESERLINTSTLSQRLD